jgi:lysylphosphatidylglycerol synthetase-like protein (DUF2156 family)
MTKKELKKQLKEKTREYQAYSNYMSLGIAVPVIMALAAMGVTGNLGVVLLVVTIMAHKNAISLKDMPKIKHVAPILVYAINILSIVFVALAFIANDVEIYLTVLGLFSVVLQIVTAVFAIVAAQKWKKLRPNMNEEAKQARAEYKEQMQALKSKTI